ncbi:MAG: hypothetical protein ACXWFI_01165 [Methylobacter sp.]
MKKIVSLNALSAVLGLSVFIGCQSVMAVPIYRGVDRLANGNAKLTPNQFNFNPELSTFNAVGIAPVQKPCEYRFDVSGGNIQNPPNVGEHGDVTGLVGYTATFDNNPPGHWSIQQPHGVSADNARTAVSVYALANRGNVVNGTQACQ